MNVHLESATVEILRSKEKDVLPMISMRRRLNRTHQPWQLLLSFWKDLSIGSNYFQQVDEVVYLMHYFAMHFLVLDFAYLVLQSIVHIRFQTKIFLLHKSNNQKIIKKKFDWYVLFELNEWNLLIHSSILDDNIFLYWYAHH